jgi:hypothetical protein
MQIDVIGSQEKEPKRRTIKQHQCLITIPTWKLTPSGMFVTNDHT